MGPRAHSRLDQFDASSGGMNEIGDIGELRRGAATTPIHGIRMIAGVTNASETLVLRKALNR